MCVCMGVYACIRVHIRVCMCVYVCVCVYVCGWKDGWMCMDTAQQKKVIYFLNDIS